MNISLFKKGFSLLSLLIGLLIINCGAANYNAFAGDDDGRFGIVRYKAPLKGMEGAEINSRFNNIITPSSHSSSSPVVFSGFSSNLVSSISGTDAPVVVPSVPQLTTFLYVAFWVPVPITSVDITWRIANTGATFSSGFSDPETGGNLLPSFWYFAWYKPSGSETIIGVNNASITVSDPVSTSEDTASFSFEAF